MIRGQIDEDLDRLVTRQGGFTTTLNHRDRQRLRAIVRKVHLQHYPGHLIDDLLCDRVIDAIAPETAAYLIRLNMDQGTL